MRILYFGSTDGTACALHYFTAFARLGHEVLPFDPGYFRAEGPLERIARRLHRGPIPARRRRVAARLEQLCRRNRFDAVFVMAENFLGAADIEAARAASGDHRPLFLYHSHDNNFAPGILRPPDFAAALAAYDVAFTTKSQNVARYRALGQARAHYVPSAFEPTVHHPVPPELSCLPGPLAVSFVGTFAPSRLAQLEAAGWDRLHVWGSDWPRWSGFDAHRDRITPNPVYFFELADVLSRSRISLGFLREEAEDLHTQRTFEIPACGTLQVAPRNDEMLSLFEEDREIVCYSSTEELRDKLTWYLGHEKERARIARQGYQRCLDGKHTYVDRCDEMLRVAFEKRKTRAVSGRRRD